MKVRLDREAKAYLEKTGVKRLLITMSPDVTNTGCGCGRTKKYYTPYIRPLKEREEYKDHLRMQIDNIELLISPKAQQASDGEIRIRLEKSLFVKNLALEGIGFIVED